MIKMFICGAVAGISLLLLVLYFVIPMGILWFDYSESETDPLIYAEFPKRVQSGKMKYVLLKSIKVKY